MFIRSTSKDYHNPESLSIPLLHFIYPNLIRMQFKENALMVKSKLPRVHTYILSECIICISYFIAQINLIFDQCKLCPSFSLLLYHGISSSASPYIAAQITIAIPS